MRNFWDHLFYRTPLDDCFWCVNEKVAIFNRNVLDTFNVILHETIVCNDRDPPWFNDKIRLLLKEKTTLYKYFCQNGNDAYRNIVWNFSGTSQLIPSNHQKENGIIEWLVAKYKKKKFQQVTDLSRKYT